MSSRRALPWPVVVALLMAALLFSLRLQEAGLWQDEGLTLYQIRLPVAQIIANRIPVAQFDTQNTVPPLYFLLMGGWGRLVGFDLWPLRLASVGMALLAIALLYPLGRAMGGESVGRVTALLGALSPLYLWYAQELRMYALVLLLSPLSLLLLWRLYQRRGQRHMGAWLLAWVVVSGALAWTHYLALLFIAAQALWLTLWLLRSRPRLLIALLLLALALSPLLRFGLARLATGAERDFFFIPFDRLVTDWLQSVTLGLPLFQSRIAYPGALALLVLALLGLGGWQAWRRGGAPLASLLGMALVLPLLALFALSFIKPLYQNARHLIFLAPPCYLLAALALQRLHQRHPALPLAAISLWAAALLPSYATYFDGSQARKNDVQPLFEYLAAQITPGDAVALNDPVLRHVLDYFAPGVPTVELPPYGYPTTLEEREAAYRAVTERYPRLWYVYGPPDSSASTWEEVLYWFNGRYSWLGYQEFPGQTRIGVIYYDLRGSSVEEEPFPLAQAQEATVAGDLRLLGLSQPLRPSEAGHRALVETVWTVTAQPDSSFQFRLSLVDGAGRLWVQTQSLPFDGIHPTDHWLPAQYVRLPLFLDLQATLPPADYRVQLEVVGSDGRLAEVAGGGTTLALGTLPITRTQRPVPLEGAHLGGLVVAPSPLPTDPLPIASTLGLRLTVRVEEADRLPDTLHLTLRDGAGSALQRYDLPLEAGLPAGEEGQPRPPSGGWQQGDTVELRYELPLPPALMGPFSLTLAATRAGQPLPATRAFGLLRSETLSLGRARVAERPIVRTLPPLTDPLEIVWPGAVTLRGAIMEPPIPTTAEPLRVRLVWQAIAPTERPYKVFLHLVDGDGTLVAGADAFPSIPTVAWQPDEVVTSDHEFALSGLAPGRYQLRAGLYDEATGERLAVEAPDASPTLVPLEIVAP